MLKRLVLAPSQRSSPGAATAAAFNCLERLRLLLQHLHRLAASVKYFMSREEVTCKEFVKAAAGLCLVIIAQIRQSSGETPRCLLPNDMMAVSRWWCCDVNGRNPLV